MVSQSICRLRANQSLSSSETNEKERIGVDQPIVAVELTSSRMLKPFKQCLDPAPLAVGFDIRLE